MATDPISAALKAVLDKLKAQQQQQPQQDPTIPPGYGRPDPFAPVVAGQPPIPVRQQSQWNGDDWMSRQVAQEAAHAQRQAQQQQPSAATGGSMLTTGGSGGFSRPPSAPAYPQEPAYQRPAPIFNEADWRNQLNSEFDYARRAADVAINNQLRLTGGSQRDLMNQAATNQIRTAGGTQRDLIGAQFAGQRSLMGGTQMDLANQAAANQIRAMGAATDNQIRSMGGTQRQLQGDRVAAASNATQQQADLNLRNQSTLMAQAGNAQMSAMRAAPRTSTLVGGNINPQIAQAVANERAKLEFEQLQRQRKGLSGGGGSGGGGGGGMPYQAVENPAVALQRDRLAAQERLQANDLAGRERMQAADIAARAALAVQAGQNRQTEIQTQGQTEDELRRKAAMRALEVFSGANPRGRQLSLSNSGRVA